MKPSEAQHDYIELMGRWWEKAVGSRAGGRILGWLMICEPPHQSSAELIEALDLSAGSVSNQRRFLENLGFIEKVTFSGDRTAYYQMRPHAWVDVMVAKQSNTDTLLTMANAAVELMPQTGTRRITELVSVAEFMKEEWPQLLSRLKERVEKENP